MSHINNGYWWEWPTQPHYPPVYEYTRPQQGWQCPVCGSVYAPTVPTCYKNHQHGVVTTTTGALITHKQSVYKTDTCVCGNPWENCKQPHEKRSSFGEDSCSCGRDWPCKYAKGEETPVKNEEEEE